MPWYHTMNQTSDVPSPPFAFRIQLRFHCSQFHRLIRSDLWFMIIFDWFWFRKIIFRQMIHNSYSMIFFSISYMLIINQNEHSLICVAESSLVELIGCYFVFCSVLLWTVNSESLSGWEVWKLLMPTSSSWMQHLPGSWMHLPVPCSASMLQRPNLSLGPVLKVSMWHCLSPSRTQSNQMTGLWTLPSVLRLWPT